MIWIFFKANVSLLNKFLTNFTPCFTKKQMVMFILIVYSLFKDNTQIAIELFDNAIAFLDISSITFDPWYSSTKLLEHIHRKEKIYFSELNHSWLKVRYSSMKFSASSCTMWISGISLLSICRNGSIFYVPSLE